MPLTDSDVDYIAQVVKSQSAIMLDRTKQYLIESRLQTLARDRGVTSIEELVRSLRQAPGGPLRDAVVEAMTTNETSFFRDIHPFRALQQSIIPELVQRNAAHRKLAVWCGASSSGQEPYTIAMVLKEALDPGWTTRILATDISPQMLERTRQGIYNQFEVNRGLPAPLMVKYFERNGMNYQITQQLRAMVETRQLNLAEPFPTLPTFDVIFLRNVLIYFDVDVKRRILQQLKKVLHPQGYLFLGGAETTVSVDETWRRETVGRATVYRPKV